VELKLYSYISFNGVPRDFTNKFILENFSPRSVTLTNLYQLLQLKVAKSVILLSLLAHTLPFLYLILIFSVIRDGHELNETKGIVLIILSSAICSEDIEFEVYGHTEKVNKFGETRAWTEGK
jgi:hypothetical protein